MNEALKGTLSKFSNSNWDLIEVPAKLYLGGADNKDALILALEQADKECGNCGCEFDILYKEALAMLRD